MHNEISSPKTSNTLEASNTCLFKECSWKNITIFREHEDAGRILNRRQVTAKSMLFTLSQAHLGWGLNGVTADNDGRGGGGGGRGGRGGGGGGRGIKEEDDEQDYLV
ncbi:keratin, type II cytoskeletal 1b-like isoform X2 [Felis catus]|uniref:keratin, type II cytoskeletal 1b-like isoform X2 n=1 Tax=Felis catus TaxID=9685 RepID=UPI000C2F84F4|nr:keratin, type II cytoskeletal 1b-like isoform X2 [Felis catus]